MNWNHKGVDITLNEGDGRFVATINGKPVRTTSLQAMKDQINKAAASVFQPFNAVEVEYGRVVPVKVTAFIAKGPEYEVEINGYRKTRRAVIPDTPENREAANAYAALYKRNSEEMERLKHELQDATKEWRKREVAAQDG